MKNGHALTTLSIVANERRTGCASVELLYLKETHEDFL